MKNQNLPFVLIGSILLVVILTQIIPWQALVLFVFIGLIVFAFLGHLRLEADKERSAAIPQYQPKQPVQPPSPSTPSSTLKPGFHLTAEEYRQLSKQYQQGYQEQKPTTSQQNTPQVTGWSPFLGMVQDGQTRQDQPKQDHPIDYEQPQAQYPEQTPPMI